MTTSLPPSSSENRPISGSDPSDVANGASVGVPTGTHNATTISAPASAFLSRFLAAFSPAMRLRLQRVGRGLLVLVVLLYFLFGTAVLLLRYVVLPSIGEHKAQVERLASQALGNALTVAAIDASWDGLRPRLVLDQVVIHDAAGKPALTLPRVAATLSWWSVPAADLRLHSLEIDRPKLDALRTAEGKLFIAGLPVNTDSHGDSRGVEWVLKQREIRIRDGYLRWTDQQRNAPELALEQVQIVLRNDWRRHRLALRATPPQALAAPLDVRADFVHPRFARRAADFSLWEGELYAQLGQTDLAAWQPYVDYPIELSRGRGAVRAWLALDHARVANLTLDLGLSDVQARLATDLQPLDLTRVNGRISLGEPNGPRHRLGVFSLGANGHTLALTDFSLQTAEGLVLPRSTLRTSHVPAEGDQPERTDIAAGLVDLGSLAQLASRLPLPASQRALLDELAPRGTLRNFNLQWQGRYPEIVGYRIKGEFQNLSLQAPPSAAAPGLAASKTEAVSKLKLMRTALTTDSPSAPAALPFALPGFENLSGQIDADERSGKLQLDAAQFRLHAPALPTQQQLSFDKLLMQAEWSRQKDRRLLVELRKLEFDSQGMKGALSGRHLLPLQSNALGRAGMLELNGTLDVLELSTLHGYLPERTEQHLRHWLTGGLLSGTARDVKLRIKGDLAQFPFHATQPGRKPEGEFSVTARIDNGRLDYAPGQRAADGKLPLWPELENIQGTIAFDRTRMEVRAQSAMTSRVALSNVRAIVPDLLAHDAVLQVEGNASGPLQDFLRFTNISPVGGWIERFTERTQASGDARLALKLQLPLAQLERATVRGSLEFINNQVQLFDGLPPLEAAAGRLEFHEKGFSLQNLRANFLGGRVNITGGTQRDGTTQVRAEGALTADGVRRQYNMPVTQRSTERVSGSTRYVAQVRVRNKRSEVVVESGLQGLALDFPAPLRKTASETLPLRFEMTSLPAAADGGARDELRLSIGSAIAARYLREKAADPNAPWRVQRGAIGVNTPATLPDSGVLINANMRSLDVDAWQRALHSLGAPRVDASAANGAAPSGDLAQYLSPQVLAARADELIVMGRKLDDVVVGVSDQGDAWQANINSQQAAGYVTWKKPVDGQGLGRVTARLASLIIPESAAQQVDELIEGGDASIQMPAIDIAAENFELFGKKFGQLELIAYNPRGARGREWRIGKLAIVNPDGSLRASGKWTSNNGDNQSSLNYVLQIADAGRLLERLGFANVLRGGQGKMEGDLNWRGKPYAFDIPTLSGQMQLNLGAGQFLKADPGAAKLIGVLSLQSLPRRLALDFRDVFSEGMAFDSMNAAVNIDEGVARTDNFKMRGVAATVLLDGTADIARETQDMHVVVIPEINAGAASVVYGLAVNPVIGVGSFLAQLFLREPLMRAFTFELKVSGPWKDPQVTKLQRNRIATEERAENTSGGTN